MQFNRTFFIFIFCERAKQQRAPLHLAPWSMNRFTDLLKRFGSGKWIIQDSMLLTSFCITDKHYVSWCHNPPRHWLAKYLIKIIFIIFIRHVRRKIHQHKIDFVLKILIPTFNHEYTMDYFWFVLTHRLKIGPLKKHTHT